MSTDHEYKYLLADYWYPYKLLFLKDPRKLRADRIYGQLVGEDARTPEAVAADYNLPVEAVYEVIHYCTHNMELVRQERARELADLEELEKNHQRPRPAGARPPQ
jgi:hypothetical protein